MSECPARFLKQHLKDPAEDARMQCARPRDHKQRHRNASGDLTWSQGLEVDVKDLLDEPDTEPGGMSRWLVEEAKKRWLVEEAKKHPKKEN